MASASRFGPDEVLSLRTQLASLEQKIAAYESRIRESDEKTAALQYELAAISQKLENKQQILNEMTDSGSWQVTKPLRKLAKAFPNAAAATRDAIKTTFRLVSQPSHHVAGASTGPQSQTPAARNTASSEPLTWSDNHIESLLNSCPAVHGDVTYGLETETLRFIDRHVSAGSRTLETGSGLSTVLFAYRGTRHTCVTPWQLEVARITKHCNDHGIQTDGVTFAVGSSDEILPSLLHAGPLDLVLIDGGHGFPLPFVDWLYSAPRLEVGGLVVIDDTHLWTGAILRDFLSLDPDWKLEALFARGAAFRKVNEFRNKEWNEQPYTLRQSQH